MGIQFILCFNKQGIVRLVRWYDRIESPKHPKTQDYIGSIYRVLSSKDHKNQSNFVDFTDQTKLVYKRFAGLYFVMGIDKSDEEAIYLAHIQLFVEILDAFFGNVCELDIVYNFFKAYMVLDEVFLGGEVQEVSKNTLLDRISLMDKLE